MQALVWTGVGVALIGLAGLVWCILQAVKARRAGLGDAAMRARLKTLVAWNLGALAVSAIGLMLCVLGVLLG